MRTLTFWSGIVCAFLCGLVDPAWGYAAVFVLSLVQLALLGSSGGSVFLLIHYATLLTYFSLAPAMQIANDVDFWETDGNYVRLHVGGTSHLIRSTAASIEPQLDPRAFLRIHRRYIVNVDRIVEVQPWFAGDAIVVLRNGAKLRLSRTYRERLHSRLGARVEPTDVAVD